MGCRKRSYLSLACPAQLSLSLLLLVLSEQIKWDEMRWDYVQPHAQSLNVNTRQLELEVLSWILQLLLIVSDSYYKHCFWLLIGVNSTTGFWLPKLVTVGVSITVTGLLSPGQSSCPSLRLMASRCCSCAYALVSPWNLNIRPRRDSLTTLLENKKRGKK